MRGSNRGMKHSRRFPSNRPRSVPRAYPALLEYTKTVRLLERPRAAFDGLERCLPGLVFAWKRI